VVCHQVWVALWLKFLLSDFRFSNLGAIAILTRLTLIYNGLFVKTLAKQWFQPFYLATLNFNCDRAMLAVAIDP
jgi:hypothetical protein